MESQLSNEEVKLIEKFGFRVEGETVTHKKMDINRGKESFQGFASLEGLEDYIKSLLRAS